MDFTALIDAQFAKATEEGAFENLPHEGRPLENLDRSAVDVWLENKMSEEGMALPLPAGLQLRKDVQEELDELKRLDDEDDVRAGLQAINARIRRANARHIRGPSSGLSAIDVEGWVTTWRAAR